MLTVKLKKQRVVEGVYKDPEGEPAGEILYDTKIVEGELVDIYELRPGLLYEISVENVTGSQFVYYVANPNEPRPKDILEGLDMYYGAYIENSAGKTTEKVGWL